LARCGRARTSARPRDVGESAIVGAAGGDFLFRRQIAGAEAVQSARAAGPKRSRPWVRRGGIVRGVDEGGQWHCTNIGEII